MAPSIEQVRGVLAMGGGGCKSKFSQAWHINTRSRGGGLRGGWAPLTVKFRGDFHFLGGDPAARALCVNAEQNTMLATYGFTGNVCNVGPISWLKCSETA